jgi:TonB family protein
MTAEVWLADLVAGWVQIGVITTVAALLLRMMPARSPGTGLAYLQTLLGVCLLLPAVEPWRASRVTTGISARAVSVFRASTPGAVPFPASKVLLALLAAGIAARLMWLVVGYAKLRGFRHRATPLAIEPLPIARGAHAEVYVSREVSGPVTFSFRRPTVLLPSRWLELVPAHQNAILWHELLHVRRGDWVFHVSEEIIRAVLWFHPAVWWLIAEIRLAREQVVDHMVVGITGAPRCYVEVLLDFAGIDSPIAAPAFTRKRHLARRIKSLLQEVSMTKSRSITTLTIITLCLAAAGAVAVWAFPLESVSSTFIAQDDSAPAAGIVRGVAQGVVGGVVGGVPGGVIGGVVGGVPGAKTVAAGPQEPPLHHIGENGVSAPKVLHKIDPDYTKEARDAKIEGTTVLTLEVHPDGRAHNLHVARSLDPGLDQKAIEAISQWEFEPGKKDGKPVAVQATIEVNFKLH